MKNIILFTFSILLFISCGVGEKKEKKEKFKYERTKESSENIPTNNPDDYKVILNSFDNMIYDKNKIEVNSGKNIV
jgi:hypothetical protein